jgi:histidinol dehydrogenase
MAYGTESVPKVYKIFGPGNQYVMAAKQQVSLHDVAIDMPAGPSEVCVIADEHANIEFVAADLLSQAEHGVDSQVLLITTSEQVILDVQAEVNRQLDLLPRKEIAAKALENSRMVLVKDMNEAIDLSNAYAPEHLILQTADYEKLAKKVVNAGSVFLGEFACESAGDYASGTNHTLPTHGYATAYSGVNLDSYCRKVTFQHLTADGIRSIGHAVELMAEAEQLEAHKNAMSVRLNAIKNKN